MAVVALGLLAGCSTRIAGNPAAPASDSLEIASIPVTELSTSGPAVLDENHPCDDIPAEVVTPAGFADPPVADRSPGCVWAAGLVLTISSFLATSMADEVAEHLAPWAGDETSHLAWLRIGGHYAIERVLASDTASTCTVILDVSAARPVYIMVYRVDHDYEDVDTDARTSIDTFCPVSRKVARNLLRHLDSH